jgi:hypothetical protein
MNTAELDTALINQKNMILTLINDGEFEKAMTALSFSRQLWSVCGYAYKTEELKTRIVEACWHNMVVATHWKQQKKWRDMYDIAKGV